MKSKLLMLASVVLTFSCSGNDDDQAPLGSYDNGVLILNEGGAGTVTYLSNDFQTVQQDVFSVVNGNTQNIGLYVQSMFFDGERAFIISNGSNKITVINRYTFEYIATITEGLDIPRYGIAFDGKAYVTNLASFGSDADDYISVIDLTTFNVEPPIQINDYAERIIEKGGKIYVANGSFGSGNSITVVDPVSKTISGTIDLGSAPNSFEAAGNVLYVLCSGFTEAKLVRIDTETDELIDSVTFPSALANAFNLDVDNGSAYFSVGSKVYKMDSNSSAVNTTPLFDTGSDSDYIGYGFAVNNGKVFISEAAEDFSSDGAVFIYSNTGTFIDEIPVGVGPNGFYFN